MTKIESLKDLFVEQLRDRYDAAKQQADFYPKLEGSATDSKLRRFVEKDIESNKKHLEKLEEIFAEIGESPEGETCEGTRGLIHEAHELFEYIKGVGEVMDVGIAVSIQHINHHDIAGYTACAMYAKASGHRAMAKALDHMADEEKSTDDHLRKVIAHILKEEMG